MSVEDDDDDDDDDDRPWLWWRRRDVDGVGENNDVDDCNENMKSRRIQCVQRQQQCDK